MGGIGPGSESLGVLAAGTLDPVFRLMLETRAMLDSQAEKSILEADLIGAAYFHDAEERPMRGNALACVMEKIAAAERMPREDELPHYLQGLPHELRETVSKAQAQQAWQTVAEGIRILSLQIPLSTVEQNGGNVYLVEMDSGSSVGRHRHLAEEYTLVLKGSVAAENEEPISVGSLLLRSSGSVHRPEAACEETSAMLVVLTGGVESVPDQISA